MTLFASTMIRLYALTGLVALSAVMVDECDRVEIGNPAQPHAVSVSGLTKTEAEIVAELLRRMDSVEMRADAAVDSTSALWWLFERQSECFAPGGAGGGHVGRKEGERQGLRVERGASTPRLRGGRPAAAAAHAEDAVAPEARVGAGQRLELRGDGQRATSADGVKP